MTFPQDAKIKSKIESIMSEQVDFFIKFITEIFQELPNSHTIGNLLWGIDICTDFGKMLA